MSICALPLSSSLVNPWVMVTMIKTMVKTMGHGHSWFYWWAPSGSGVIVGSSDRHQVAEQNVTGFL